VCAHLGIELEHHHAGSDALAAANVLLRLRGMGMDDATIRLK
jgi:DNA polymerase-3 subunit epsilon